MSSNSLAITAQYPMEKYNLLVPMQTIAEIAEIQKPVMNTVTISTDLEDKEIYEQEKAKGSWTDNKNRNHPATPARYALTKKGLTKLMRAAGIKILSSRPIVPSTCQKCAEINKGIGKPVNCGNCKNKDVKFEVRVSAPQLTGESIEIVAHKEIIVDDVIADMTDKQRAEFLKFRNEMCESKALNRALRTAMQIKGTYLIEELNKPFVVAYLVPNLDNPDVKQKAVESFFQSAREIYGNNVSARKTLFVDDDIEDTAAEARQNPTGTNEPYRSDVYTVDYTADESPPRPKPAAAPQQQRKENAPSNDRQTVCCSCGVKITGGVHKYSIENFGEPLCMNCQNRRGANR
jgi:hypothetical protein